MTSERISNLLIKTLPRKTENLPFLCGEVCATGGLARTDNLLQFCILLFPTCVASLLPACMFLNRLEKDKGKAMISPYFLIQFYV